jgi:hypothetical protein
MVDICFAALRRFLGGRIASVTAAPSEARALPDEHRRDRSRQRCARFCSESFWLKISLQPNGVAAGGGRDAIREILLRELLTEDMPSVRLEGAKNRNGVGRDAILKELEGVNGVNDNIVRQQLVNRRLSSVTNSPVQTSQRCELSAFVT